MHSRSTDAPDQKRPKANRKAFSLVLMFLLIEFYDELSFGIERAALPAIRSDLNLSYSEVGLFLGLPLVFGSILEPFLMLLGDSGMRRRMVIAGGLALVLVLLLIASSWGFPVLMLAMLINYPSSGVFVSLSQATLMDLNPGREPQMMARWTLAGSLGVTIGPLIIAASLGLGLGWRWAFVGLAVLCASLVVALLPNRFPNQQSSGESFPTLPSMLKSLRQAVRKEGMIRWILLLQASDLLLDVFLGYLPLYYTDVAGSTPGQASLALGIFLVAGLIGDAALIPLLERVPGRTVVRASAAVVAFLYALWLVAPATSLKWALLIAVGLGRLGWYSVLKGEAFAAAPGQSGAVLALTGISGILAGAIAWALGWAAGRIGLTGAMWFLLLGPAALVFFVPRPTRAVEYGSGSH